MNTEKRIPNQYISVEDLAKRFGCSVYTVRSWIRKRAIPFYKGLGGIRFKLGDVEAFAESKKILPRKQPTCVGCKKTSRKIKQRQG